MVAEVSYRDTLDLEDHMVSFIPGQPPAPTKEKRKRITKMRNGGVEEKPHRGRYAPPPGETARERFIRLGQARMVNALHAIRLLGNLSSDLYQVTDRDVALMHSTLTEAINDALGRFRRPSTTPKLEETFKLDR
jgi:hypothetical protein